METGCSLKGISVSFKGGRGFLIRSDHRAPPTLSPHPVGRPFRPSRIPPLVGRWRVTTGRRSYEC
jgi:hypothetical protein